jgi:ABC-type polysaccharide/polyol phosphate export permease
MLASRDIKIRYKQSIMGFFWAVLMPILIIGSGLIVMIAFATLSGKPVNKTDVFAVAIKAVPWAFFVAAVRFATTSLTMNKELVTKIYFPREILPLASVLANLFDFSIAAAVLAVVLTIARIAIGVTLFWVPLLLCLLVLLSSAAALFLACANLFYRDVKYLVEVILTYGVFFTPVFYSASKMGKWGSLLLLNPVSPILEALNDVILLRQPPNLAWLGYSAAWACIGLYLSYLLFRRAEPLFAESI